MIYSRPVELGFVIPRMIATRLRESISSIKADYDTNEIKIDELNQLYDDVWFGFKPVGEHTDTHHLGGAKPWTTGLILINDGNYMLKVDSHTLYLPAGSVYQIDSSKLHGTVSPTYNSKPGEHLFAFLAWDAAEYGAWGTNKQFAMEAISELACK